MQADTQYTDRIKIYLDDSGGGRIIFIGEYRPEAERAGWQQTPYCGA